MTLRQYIAIMSIATLLCWMAWGLVLFNVDPFEASVVGHTFFYVSFFLSLLGTLSLLLFGLMYFFSRHTHPLFHYVRQSFHQGALAALIVTMSLYLLGRGWLYRSNAVFLAAALLSCLFFFIFHHKSHRRVQDGQY